MRIELLSHVTVALHKPQVHWLGAFDTKLPNEGIADRAMLQ
jgi:hypothetical protein